MLPAPNLGPGSVVPHVDKKARRTRAQRGLGSAVAPGGGLVDGPACARGSRLRKCSAKPRTACSEQQCDAGRLRDEHHRQRGPRSANAATSHLSVRGYIGSAKRTPASGTLQMLLQLLRAHAGVAHESIPPPNFAARRGRVADFCRTVICPDRPARFAGPRPITDYQRCAGCRRRRFARQARGETADCKGAWNLRGGGPAGSSRPDRARQAGLRERGLRCTRQREPKLHCNEIQSGYCPSRARSSANFSGSGAVVKNSSRAYAIRSQRLRGRARHRFNFSCESSRSRSFFCMS